MIFPKHASFLAGLNTNFCSATSAPKCMQFWEDDGYTRLNGTLVVGPQPFCNKREASSCLCTLPYHQKVYRRYTGGWSKFKLFSKTERVANKLRSILPTNSPLYKIVFVCGTCYQAPYIVRKKYKRQKGWKRWKKRKAKRLNEDDLK